MFLEQDRAILFIAIAILVTAIAMSLTAHNSGCSQINSPTEAIVPTK